MKTLLTVMMLLTACGTDPSQGTKESSDSDKALSTVDAPDKAQAMLIEKKEKLPKCDEGLETQLAYVVEMDEFYTCSEKDWKAINIRGKDGKDGKDGENGVSGKDGQDGVDGLAGANGQDGVNGKDGKDAKTLAATEWEHPLTGALWFLTGQYFNQLQASSCPTGSRFPTSAEWLSAFGSGITNKLGESLNIKQRAWISETTYVQLYVGATQLSNLGTQTERDPTSSNGALSYRALCIKE